MVLRMYEGTPFDLSGRVCVVTGALGLLGRMHCEVLRTAGAFVVNVDRVPRADVDSDLLAHVESDDSAYVQCDITRPDDVEELGLRVMRDWGVPRVLINNAAHNPKVEGDGLSGSDRLEDFPLERWREDIEVGLTGAMLCSRTLGATMAEAGEGVIVNISSDLGLIAPDQRLYAINGLNDRQQPKKPVSYSVVKAGIIGLTRYLATYWSAYGVRCNALAPGGVRTDQDPAFIMKLESLIPLGRMADADEYKGAILYLSSDASRYTNGAVLVCDGGRTAW